MAEPLQETEFQNLNATGQNLSSGEISISGLFVVNNTGSGAFVQFFNMAAASVTLGQTVPRFQFYVPPTNNPSVYLSLVPPLRFDTRLSAFATTMYTGSTGVATGVSVQALVGL